MSRPRSSGARSTRRWFASAVLASAIWTAASGEIPVGAVGRIVAFRAADGRTISALLIEASRRPAPAVVLVPMLGRTKDGWEPAGQRLAEGNVTALAIDLPSPTLPGTAQELAAWQQDVAASVSFLASRPEVQASAIGVAGASLGASLAVLAAQADSRVRSIALISPSLDYRGVRVDAALRQYGGRPALLAASLRDPYAARSSRELAKDPPGIRQLQWSEAAAHGTVLLARDPDLVRALVDWFQRTLPVN